MNNNENNINHLEFERPKSLLSNVFGKKIKTIKTFIRRSASLISNHSSKISMHNHHHSNEKSIMTWPNKQNLIRQSSDSDNRYHFINKADVKRLPSLSTLSTSSSSSSLSSLSLTLNDKNNNNNNNDNCHKNNDKLPRKMENDALIPITTTTTKTIENSNLKTYFHQNQQREIDHNSNCNNDRTENINTNNFNDRKIFDINKYNNENSNVDFNNNNLTTNLEIIDDNDDEDQSTKFIRSSFLNETDNNDVNNSYESIIESFNNNQQSTMINQSNQNRDIYDDDDNDDLVIKYENIDISEINNHDSNNNNDQNYFNDQYRPSSSSSRSSSASILSTKYNDKNEFEMRINEQKKQIELMTKKIIYMEEHIIDLNQENQLLKKQLQQTNELNKKKLQLRENEIKLLKENYLEVEQFNNDLKLQEHELLLQKRKQQDEIKLLKKQLNTNEIELSTLININKKYLELEKQYETQQNEMKLLKQQQSHTINELDDNYRLLMAEKDFEIDILKLKINELSNIIENNHYYNNKFIHDNQYLQTSSSLMNNQNINKKQQMNSDKSNDIVNNVESSSLANELKQSLTIELNKSIEENKIKMRRKPSLKRISSCDIEDHHSDDNTTNIYDKIVPTNNNDRQPKHQSNNDYDNNINNNSTMNQQQTQQSEVFPSLPDVMLRKLCLLCENTCNIESLSEQEIDSKFHTLSLAFKTDKFTLAQRIQLYRHQRDVAENDAKNELNNLQEYIQELYRLLLSCDSKYIYNTTLLQLKELKEMLDKIDMQVQVIKATMMKISSRSELYGSVKQEEKLSAAFDVILLHTENLKRAKERDAKELEDMKRLLATTSKIDDLDDYNSGSLNNGRRSKNRDSRRINPLLMANQLQNIQVSYQQRSRGSDGSNDQKYMRTRRLSVPAAEIRNRPRLLQLFNEAAARQLRERKEETNDDNNSNNDDDNNENSDDEDEEAKIARYRKMPIRNRHRTLTSIDDHQELDNDSKDGLIENLPESKSTEKSDVINESKTTNNNDDSDRQSDEHHFNSNNDNKNDIEYDDDNKNDRKNSSIENDMNNNETTNENLQTVLTKKLSITISEFNTEKIHSFYQRLVQKLTPFEDRTWQKKLQIKIQELYCILCMILFTMRSVMISIKESGRSQFHRFRHQTNSYENLRFTISTLFLIIAALILTIAFIIPMIMK